MLKILVSFFKRRDFNASPVTEKDHVQDALKKNRYSRKWPHRAGVVLATETDCPDYRKVLSRTKETEHLLD